MVSSFDITPLDAAWRFARSLAVAMLALLAWSGAAPAEHRQAAWMPTLGASIPVADTVSAPASQEVPAGPATGFAAMPGLEWDEPGEDPFKLGRALKAAAPMQPGGARVHRAADGPDRIAASVPERPPRA